MRARLWYIRMCCDTLFWAMIFVDFCGMLWALKILCFSLWNSPVTPGRNLLSKELKCGHEESRLNVLLEWPGSLSLWPGYGLEYGPFRVLKFLQGIMEGPLCWEDKKCIRMVPWCTHVKMANHENIVRQIQIIISRASVTKREGRPLSKILFAVFQVFFCVFSHYCPL